MKHKTFWIKKSKISKIEEFEEEKRPEVRRKGLKRVNIERQHSLPHRLDKLNPDQTLTIYNPNFMSFLITRDFMDLFSIANYYFQYGDPSSDPDILFKEVKGAWYIIEFQDTFTYRQARSRDFQKVSPKVPLSLQKFVNKS